MNPLSLASTAAQSLAGVINPIEAIEATGDTFAAVFEALQPESNEASETESSDDAAGGKHRLLADVASIFPLEGLVPHAQESLDAWYDEFATHAAAAGIDLRDETHFSIGASGEIVIRGNPQHAAAIEQIFADHPELANDLRRITVQFEILQAAKEHTEFAAAYRRDPQAALLEFQHLFDDDAVGDSPAVSIRVDQYGAHA